jgi:tRNA threonylcarbamoyladenosine biosynthesis protein TsaB
MALILCIETSGSVCSVALARNGQCIEYLEKIEKNSHSKYLTSLVEKILCKTGDAIDAIALSLGPGSYTGLRIGTSVAKGLAFAKDIPIVGMNSTFILAKAFYSASPKTKSLVCPMIDARRMEVYSTVYKPDLTVLQGLAAEILDDNSYQDFLGDFDITFIGDGAEKFETLLVSKHAHFDHSQYLTAKEMASSAQDLYNTKNFLDTAYFEPNYLKEFMAIASKKKFF